MPSCQHYLQIVVGARTKSTHTYPEVSEHTVGFMTHGDVVQTKKQRVTKCILLNIIYVSINSQ